MRVFNIPFQHVAAGWGIEWRRRVIAGPDGEAFDVRTLNLGSPVHDIGFRQGLDGLPRRIIKGELFAFGCTPIVFRFDFVERLKPRFVTDSDTQPCPVASCLNGTIGYLKFLARFLRPHGWGPDRPGFANSLPRPMLIGPGKCFLVGKFAGRTGLLMGGGELREELVSASWWTPVLDSH